jgi:hypothetical protein
LLFSVLGTHSVTHTNTTELPYSGSPITTTQRTIYHSELTFDELLTNIELDVSTSNTNHSGTQPKLRITTTRLQQPTIRITTRNQNHSESISIRIVVRLIQEFTHSFSLDVPGAINGGQRPSSAGDNSWMCLHRAHLGCSCPGLRLAQPGGPTAMVSVLPISPEDGRRSIVRNVILLKYRRWTKSKKKTTFTG